MKFKRTAILLLTAALVLQGGAFQLSAFAQTVRATICTGHILQAGAVVAGADVRLRFAGEPDIVASTNAGGKFVFANIKTGDGVLIARYGQKTASRFVQIRDGDNSADLDLDQDDVTLLRKPAQPSPGASPETTPTPGRRRTVEPDAATAARQTVTTDGAAARPTTPASVPMTVPVATYTTPAAEGSAAKPEAAVPAAPAPRFASPLCDASYKGEPTDFEFNPSVSLGGLVEKLNAAYGARILLDNDVQQLPVTFTLSDGPWTSVLRSLLILNDLDTICLDDGLVAIGKRTKIQQIQEQRRLSAPLISDYIEVKNLQATETGTVDPSGQPQGSTGSTLDTLETQVRELLRASDKRAEFRRVPSTNIFYIAATADQIGRAKELIALADRPPFQVYMEAVMYTVNNTQRKALGGELSVVVGNGPGTNLGGVTSMPNNRGGGSGGNGSGPSGLNPGGIPGLGTGFTQPAGLTAPSPSVTIGATGIFGTAQFSAQYTAAQFKGLLNEQARPNGIVMSGQTFRIDSGLQIPITIPAIVNGGTTGGQLRFLEAGIIGNITPFVSPDGKTLTVRVRLEKNSVDTSVAGEGGNPGINRNSAQTTFQVPDDVTVVIGGLSTDSLSDALTKTPLLADIPGLGELFKKKEKNEIRTRFYYAIRFKIIQRGQPFPHVPLPEDATTAFPPAPQPQKPSPYQARP